MSHNINEDHFSAAEIDSIKACADSSVKTLYRDYVQAEAIGDTERADKLAKSIKQRCELKGIVASSTPKEVHEASSYDNWRAKMERAGGIIGEHSANAEIMTAYRIVEGQRVSLGEFDTLINAEVFTEKSQLLKKYTVESKDVADFSKWKRQVIKEGATKIRSSGNCKYAYKDDVRIGSFCRIQETKTPKKFNEILRESLSINMSMDSTSPENKTVTVTATEEDADQLMSILQLSGLPAGNTDGESSCGCMDGAGITSVEVDSPIDEYSNEPNPRVADTDTQLNKMSGGLNGPKRQVNPNNPGDNPKAMAKLGNRGKNPQVNIEEEETANSLSSEYSRFSDIKKKKADKFQQSKDSIDRTPEKDEKMITEKEPAVANQGSSLNQRLGLAYTSESEGEESNAATDPFTIKQIKLAREKIKRGEDPDQLVRIRNPNSFEMEEFRLTDIASTAIIDEGKEKLMSYINDVLAESIKFSGQVGDSVAIVSASKFNGKIGVVKKINESKRLIQVDLLESGTQVFSVDDVAIIDEEVELCEEPVVSVDLAPLFQKHNNDWSEVWQDVIYDHHELSSKEIFAMIRNYIESNGVQVDDSWDKEVKAQEWYDSQEHKLESVKQDAEDMPAAASGKNAPRFIKQYIQDIKALDEYFDMRLPEDIAAARDLLAKVIDFDYDNAAAYRSWLSTTSDEY